MDNQCFICGRVSDDGHKCALDGRQTDRDLSLVSTELLSSAGQRRVMDAALPRI